MSTATRTPARGCSQCGSFACCGPICREAEKDIRRLDEQIERVLLGRSEGRLPVFSAEWIELLQRQEDKLAEERKELAVASRSLRQYELLYGYLNSTADPSAVTQARSGAVNSIAELRKWYGTAFWWAGPTALAAPAGQAAQWRKEADDISASSFATIEESTYHGGYATALRRCADELEGK